jgi:hypothetical protein
MEGNDFRKFVGLTNPVSLSLRANGKLYFQERIFSKYLRAFKGWVTIRVDKDSDAPVLIYLLDDEVEGAVSQYSPSSDSIKLKRIRGGYELNFLPVLRTLGFKKPTSRVLLEFKLEIESIFENPVVKVLIKTTGLHKRAIKSHI